MLAVGFPGNNLGGKLRFFVLINSLLVGLSDELMFRKLICWTTLTPKFTLRAMLAHGLWDFFVFTAAQSPLALAGSIFPLLFFLYGLWLVWGYRKGQNRS